MGLAISISGTFDNTDKFFTRLLSGKFYDAIDALAARGAAALAAATPTETGASAESWSYEVDKSGGNYTIWWTNSHVDETGTPIVIMLQYGHGTGTGGYVQGRDFINPAIAPIFDEIADGVWKEVNSS
jgi:hypothetical protein